MTGSDVKIRLYMLWYQSSYLRPPHEGAGPADRCTAAQVFFFA